MTILWRTWRTMMLTTCCVVGLATAACSSDDSADAPSATLPQPSTTSVTNTVPTQPPTPTAATPTSLAPTSTAAASSTTTTTPAPTTIASTTTTVGATTTVAPTTTVPPGAALTLLSDGIGDARFGDDPDDVIRYVNQIVGNPADDSGWVDALSRTCPGTEVRLVRWADLTLLFGDDSDVATGRRHFFAWSFGPPAAPDVTPAGVATAARVSVGSTVSDIATAYPGASLFEGDELADASVHIDDDLFAFVTSIDDFGVVTAMLGGQGCGE